MPMKTSEKHKNFTVQFPVLEGWNLLLYWHDHFDQIREG
jgi:hypothetical protein